jgi:hypothetical protein
MSRPDKNLVSIADEVVIDRHFIDLIPPDDSYADTLKFSNATTGVITARRIVGGREDCVDINNGSARLHISAEAWEPRGKYLATIKGGSRDITLAGTVTSHGSEVDVDLGNRSDQSREIVRGIRLDLKTTDGSPIRVRLLLAERPRILNAADQEYRFVFPSQVPLWLRRLGFRAWEWLRKLGVLPCLLLVLAGCATFKPQQGGRNSVILGGSAPTTAALTAPENPQTSTKQTVEKTTVREYAPPAAAAAPQEPSRPVSPGHEAPSTPSIVNQTPSPPALLRETISETSVTELGTAQKDTARELGARLANMRGVLWIGVLLLIGGPVVGWKMGWLLNGLIAGAVGLLLIILSTVIPGNEAWFGLGGLLLIPLVAYVYYRAHYDANKDGIPDRLQRQLRDINPPAS